MPVQILYVIRVIRKYNMYGTAAVQICPDIMHFVNVELRALTFTTTCTYLLAAVLGVMCCSLFSASKKNGAS